MLEHNGDIILDKNVFNLYEKVEVLEKVENYNKNHGDGGRFSSGIGGLTSSQIDKYSAMAYESGSDFYRSEFMEKVTKDLKFDGKPGVATSIPKGADIQYRGWDEKAHIDSYKNSSDPRLSIGIFGSGLYFTTDQKLAKTYTGSSSLVTTSFINKNAKIGDSIKLRDEMFAASDKLSTRQNKERVALKDIKGKIPRVEAKVKLTQKHNNENKLFTDLGAYAAIKGYDVIQAPGEIVVLNRSMITFVEEK